MKKLVVARPASALFGTWGSLRTICTHLHEFAQADSQKPKLQKKQFIFHLTKNIKLLIEGILISIAGKT